jgi:hypothetical protein
MYDSDGEDKKCIQNFAEERTLVRSRRFGGGDNNYDAFWGREMAETDSGWCQLF